MLDEILLWSKNHQFNTNDQQKFTNKNNVFCEWALVGVLMVSTSKDLLFFTDLTFLRSTLTKKIEVAIFRMFQIISFHRQCVNFIIPMQFHIE